MLKCVTFVPQAFLHARKRLSKFWPKWYGLTVSSFNAFSTSFYYVKRWYRYDFLILRNATARMIIHNTLATRDHPELLTFGETRNNRLYTFVPLYTLALRSMMPQNIDIKSNANMNAWRKSAGTLSAFLKIVVFILLDWLFSYVLGCRLCPNFKIFLNIHNLCKHFNRV